MVETLIFFIIPLVLFIAFIVILMKVARWVGERYNFHPVSIILAIFLAITVVILGERLLYDVNRWLNPAYDVNQFDYPVDVRETTRHIIYISLGVLEIIFTGVVVICGLLWGVNAAKKRQTAHIMKILFALSIIGVFLIGAVWMTASYILFSF